MAKLSFKFRIHEWLAEHVKWIQYPGVQAVSSSPFFKNQMHWSTRMMLVLLGCIVLIVCAIALFFLGLFFWAIITA
jgi:hypothetical protein